MKFLCLLVITFLAQNSLAGIDDFNQMIEETRQQEQKLRTKLVEQTGQTKGLDASRDLSGLRKQMEKPEAETVIVEDSNIVYDQDRPDFRSKTDNKNSKRISKELDLTEAY